MRILYVAMDNSNYADRSHEIKVAETMARAGHAVSLVAEREPKWTKESPRPINLRFLGVPSVNVPTAANTIANMLPTDVDVAFTSSVSGAPILAAWKKRTGKPAVAQVLDVPLWRLRLGQHAPWFEAWRPWYTALMQMDHIVVNTEQTASDMAKVARMYTEVTGPPVQGSVVYYGIDTETAGAVLASDGKYFSPGAERYVCAAARLVFYKGYDYAMNALSRMDPKDRPGYVIVGNGEEAGRLIQHAALQLLGGHVDFRGGVSDVEKFKTINGSVGGLYLAWNPHIPSQFPVESIYMGKPCVVADIPINRDRLEGCPWGVRLVSAEDPGAVRHEVEMMLAPEDDADGIHKAREWVEQNRSFQSHARGILEVLAGVT